MRHDNDGTGIAGATLAVSFAIASYNTREFLEQAVTSALTQTDVTCEVLVVDDGSRDGSVELAHELADRDDRVRVFATPRNSGPGGARNIALREMRGDWFAILDSDDYVAPERSRSLIAFADTHGADMVADDLLIFGDGISNRRFLDVPAGNAARIVDLEGYFRQSRLFGAEPTLGFLKPMIRTRFIRRHGIAYDEDLRIGEDDALVVRLLLAGARYVLSPQCHYHYRKHGSSISHRLSLDHAERMMRAEEGIRVALPAGIATGDAYRGRFAAMERGLAFTRSVEQLKARQFGSALATLRHHPSAIGLYRMVWNGRVDRLKSRLKSRLKQRRAIET